MAKIRKLNVLVSKHQRMKKENRGGKRKGAGRNPTYNEPTTTISFRVPESKVTEIKEIVEIKLKEIRIK